MSPFPLRPALLLWLACTGLSCRTTAAPPEPASPSVDQGLQALTTWKGRHQLGCVDCHADRDQLVQGRISPGPPWPGTLGRSLLKGARLDARQAVDLCAVQHGGPVLPAKTWASVALFLDGQGAALPGQPAVYRAAVPRPARELAALRMDDGDSFAGEKVFARACAACHADDVHGYGPDVLRAQSPREVVNKVLGPRHDQDAMPLFVDGALSTQDVLDVAQWIGGGG